MSDSDFDQDDLVLQELKSQEIKGLTPRGKMAVHELANQDQGAMIFLVLSLNTRIRDLESTIAGFQGGVKH